MLALELRRSVYQEEFGHVPADGFDERAHHLVAFNDVGQIVAAMRIVGPEQRPFDLEHSIDLTDYMPADRSPALVGRLSVRHDYRGVSRKRFLPMGMFKLAYLFARKRGMTDFLTYTYPNLYQFYRGAFFQPLIASFEHPTWGTVCVMHFDLKKFEARYSQSHQLLARFIFATDSPSIVVPD